MNRRELLKGLGLILGGSLSPAVVSAALAEDRTGAIDGWSPLSLDAEQDRLVTAIAEAILPATDTPGAAAARVNQFIDLLLTEWLDEGDRQRFLVGLEELEARARTAAGQSFVDLTSEQQLGLLAPLDRDAVDARLAAAAQGLDRPAEPSFFALMKEMTLVGYYTSEIGMTQELRLPEITDTYSGCAPYDQIGRSWA